MLHELGNTGFRGDAACCVEACRTVCFILFGQFQFCHDFVSGCHCPSVCRGHVFLELWHWPDSRSCCGRATSSLAGMPGQNSPFPNSDIRRFIERVPMAKTADLSPLGSEWDADDRSQLSTGNDPTQDRGQPKHDRTQAMSAFRCFSQSVADQPHV